jgi:hypothetical protein
MPVWSIVVAATLLGLIPLLLLIRWAQQGLAKARAHLAEVAAGRTALRQSPAQSFGIRSKGAAQLRGAGYLALFDDELVFVQAIAKNHMRARRADLVGVTTPRSFLGKSQVVKLLAIEWRTGEGDATDQIGLRVSELDAWLDELGRAGVAVTRE